MGVAPTRSLGHPHDLNRLPNRVSRRMLKLYLDDTGTHKDSQVVGCGGLIGNDAQWGAFDIAWRQLLADPIPGKPPLKKWSSHDCRWGENEFRGYTSGERDRVTFLFREIITKSGLVWRANMIDAVRWNELIAGVGRAWIASAEATAFFKLIMGLQGWASLQRDGPDIDVHYDLGRMNDPEVTVLSGLLNDPLTKLTHISGVTFLPVAKATPLQGADMIATESYWYAKGYFVDGDATHQREHFKAFIKDNGERGGVQVLDRDGISRAQMRHIVGDPSWEWTVKPL